MTREEAKKELKRYLTLKDDIKRLDGKIEELRCHIQALGGASYEEKIKGGVNDGIEVILDRIVALEKKTAKKILAWMELSDTIENKINSIYFPLSEVLKMRYLDGKSLEKIGTAMTKLYAGGSRRYTYDSIRHYLSRGIDEYAKIELEKES